MENGLYKQEKFLGNGFVIHIGEGRKDDSKRKP